jgi:hypothetical protein
MKNILIGLLASLLIATASFAGQIGIGVSGSFAAVSAEGTESDKTVTTDASVRTANASENAIVPSAFAEYSFDNGFTIGYDYVIGSANVNSRKITRTDDSSEANQDGDRSAQAEIDNVSTIYAELPIHAGLYLKGGFVQMDVTTQETFSGTLSGTYGNATIDGMLFGMGYRNSFGNNGFYKVEGTMTDMDGMKFASSTTDKGTNISADLDVMRATFAIGYNF